MRAAEGRPVRAVPTAAAVPSGLVDPVHLPLDPDSVRR